MIFSIDFINNTDINTIVFRGSLFTANIAIVVSRLQVIKTCFVIVIISTVTKGGVVLQCRYRRLKLCPKCRTRSLRQFLRLHKFRTRGENPCHNCMKRWLCLQLLLIQFTVVEVIAIQYFISNRIYSAVKNNINCY